MDDLAARLHATFLAAYRPTVRGRLRASGLAEPRGLDAALDTGEAWLDRSLRSVLEVAFAEQRRSPLEVFREAVRFPTEALEAAGIDPPRRDPATEAALPGDHYDLVPGSSQDLGEEAWRAHLAWGAAKARAMSRLTVGLLSSDLMDFARVEAAASAAGYSVAVWADAAAVADHSGRLPAVAFVDLAHPEADDVIRALAARSVRVTGYGPHVDDLAMIRARLLGATDALARSRFFTSIRDLLPSVV
jgi:hypothetical protein